MFIAITRSGQIELQDAANFRAFKISRSERQKSR